MPELTVSMPAYNSGPFIEQAIDSVLRQEGVEFVLIVVDDGSEDETAEIVRTFKDPRVRLLENPRNRGIAYCHNRVMKESDSPFIVHVDADDLVLPGAFRKLVELLKSDSALAQVHCHFFDIDRHGR